MDAGSVLDNLLERHRNFVAVQLSRVAPKAHQCHGSTPSPAPPSRIAEAVVRGVHPFILGLQPHKAESSARERAKKKRRGSAVNVSHTSQEALGHSRSVSSEAHTASATAARATRAQLQVLPSSTEVQRSREGAASVTLNARCQELRAKRREEEEERKRSRSNSAPVGRSVEGGVSDSRMGGLHRRPRLEEKSSPTQDTAVRERKSISGARVWRDVWRRRCTAKKILRLSRGVTRASALRRYWYTTLSRDHEHAGTPDCFTSAPQAPHTSQNTSVENEKGAVATTRTLEVVPVPKGLGCSASPQSVSELKGTSEGHCSLRRLRAARRSMRQVREHHQAPKKFNAAVGLAKAATVIDDTNQLPTETGTAQATTNKGTPFPGSRRQQKRAIRRILSFSATSMWTFAARAVAERLDTLAELRLECAAATAPATHTKRTGVLPLSLARLFPLFGALVEVYELTLTTAPRRSGRSRNSRRACQAVSGSGESVGSAPTLSILQKRKGVVVEEYSDTLGILLLPHQNEYEMQAWAEGVEMARGAPGRSSGSDPTIPLARMKSLPSVFRVRKHFPGASGSFVELVQLLMMRVSTRRGDRRSASTGSTVTPKPETPVASSRMLATVFCGEVRAPIEDCSSVVCHSHCDEENPRLAIENTGNFAYPLHRLLHRCL